MMLERRMRGEPLLVLALILGGWVGARVLAWQVVFDTASVGSAPVAAVPAAAPPARTAEASPAAEAPRVPVFPEAATPPPPAGIASPLAVPVLPAVPRPDEGVVAPPAPVLPPPVMATPLPPPAPATAGQRIAVAGGHQLLWLAATAFLPSPLGLRAPAPPRPPAAREPRWSGDGWMLLRRGDGTISPGPIVGNYGASQMGAVLRYRLIPGEPHRLSAYVRATAALNGTRQQEVAFGLAARPLPRVPLTAMAELRGVRDGGGERLRPALAVVSELPPQRLPAGFTGELYAQAGYVAGRTPTGFVDALARIQRPVVDLGSFRLSAGGGAWAAKQRGAARVDVGPTASVSFHLTDTASARVAADWRFRVAGESKPDSGPALTLSAGF